MDIWVLIFNLVRHTGWTVDYILSMPYRWFVGMVKEMQHYELAQQSQRRGKSYIRSDALSKQEKDRRKQLLDEWSQQTVTRIDKDDTTEHD